MSFLGQKLRSFLQKKCNVCYFLQNNECILGKNRIPICSMRVKKIKGVAQVEFYINLVSSRKLSERALFFSILSSITACLALLVNYTRTH
jgi:hypothetical protein